VLAIWKVAAPALDVLAPDIYMNDPVAYLKVLELYHRDDNALFVPRPAACQQCPSLLLGARLQAIGYSPFGMDYTRPRSAADAARPREEFLTPWAMNYRLMVPCNARSPPQL